MAITTTMRTQVTQLYVSLFGRAPEAAGLSYWVGQLDAGKTVQTVAQDMYNVDAARAYYPGSLTNDEVIARFYTNVLGRTGDTEGLNYWKGKLNLPGATKGSVIVDMINAVVAYAGTDADGLKSQALFNNKVAVGLYYGFDLNGQDLALAGAALAGVTNDVATVASAKLALANGSSTSLNAVLTVNTDNLVANTFSSGESFTPGGNVRQNTLQDEDVLTGTGTNPTLNSVIGNANNNGGTIITPTLKGVTTVNLNFTGSSGVAIGVGNQAVDTISFQRATGVTTINVLGVTNPNAGSTVTLKNIAEATTNNLSVASILAGNKTNVTFNYQPGVLAGTTDTATLTLNNANIAALTLGDAQVGFLGTQGFETLSIVSGGPVGNQANSASTSQNSISQLFNPQMSTLNISGAANLSILTPLSSGVTGSRPATFFSGAINNSGTALTTVNAGTFTGKLNIDLTGYTNVQTTNALSGLPVFLNFTGGTNDDTIYVASATDSAASKATIDGGTGLNTLKLFNTFSGDQTKAVGVTVKNIQNLGVYSQNDSAASPAAIVVDTAAIGTSLVRIDVRNENALGIGQAITLQNISAALANPATAANVATGPGLYLHHSTTGSSSLFNNIDTFTLAAGGATATAAINLVTDLNTDVRSNFNLTVNAKGAVATAAGSVVNNVGNIIINDLGNESHTIQLNSPAATSLKITGGTAGTFLSLDAASHFIPVLGLPNSTGGLQLDASGGVAFDVKATDKGLGILGNYAVLDNGRTADFRFLSTTIDSSASLADFIVRVGSVNSTNAAQTIKLGNATNTVIFDAQNNINAGLSSVITVTGGTGVDTIVIDGNLPAAGVTPAGTITLGVSEWQNVKGIDVIRLAGNGIDTLQSTGSNNVYSAGTNSTGPGVTQNATSTGGYNLTLTNALIGQADAGRTFTIVNNDGLIATPQESMSIIDGTQLATNTAFNFIGANKNLNVFHAGNNILLSDASFSKNAVLAGGNINATPAALSPTAVNNNTLTVVNTAQVSFDDLTNKTDFSTIYVKNNQATSQTATVQLNNAIIDALVDSSHAAAATAGNVEILNVIALDNIQALAVAPGFNNPQITSSNVIIDASTVAGSGASAAAFGLNIVLSRGVSVGGVAANQVTGTNTVNDTIVELGNYAPATYGAGLNLPSSVNVATLAAISVASQANGVTVGQRVVTDTINDLAATLVTYGAIDLTGVNSLSGNAALVGTLGVAKLIAYSDVTLTASEFAALTSLTFAGNANHTLRIIGGAAGSPINLAKITVSNTTNTLTIDTTVAASNGSVVSGVAAATGTAAIIGAVAPNFNSAGVVAPVLPITVVGAIANPGTVGNDTFTATDATLTTAATTIAGNGGVDTLNVTTAFTTGAKGTTSTGLSVLNLQAGGTVSGAAAFLNGFATINDNKLTGFDAITLGTVSQTLNFNNTSGNNAATTGAAGQTINQVGANAVGTLTVNTTNAFASGLAVNGTNAGGGATIVLSDVGTATLASGALNGVGTVTLAAGAAGEILTLAPTAALTVNQSPTWGASLISNSTSVITVQGGTTGALALSGTGNFVVSNTTGAITDTGTGTLTVTDAGASHSVTSSAATTINAAALGAFTDTLAGTGNFTVNGVGTAASNIILENGVTGTLTVNASNAFSSAVTEGAGTGAVTVNVVGNAGAGVTTVTTTATHASTIVNASAAAGVLSSVALAGAGNVTVNAAATGNFTLTGGAGLETINLAATGGGVDNITVASSTLGAVTSKLITINNFKATGADLFHTGLNATSLGAVTIATSDFTSLAANIQTGTGALSTTAGQAFIVTISAGTAAGTYLYEHLNATASVTGADLLVKLVGAGTLVLGDVLA